MVTPHEVGSRLSVLLKGQSLRKIGDSVGVSHTAVKRWFDGTAMPEVSTLIRLCKEYALSADYVLGLSERSEIQMQDAKGTERLYRPVPLMATEICAGPGSYMTEEVAEHHAMRKEWIRDHIKGRPYRVRVSSQHHLGESMTNTILPGAVLTVDLRPIGDREIEPLEIYLVRDENNGVMVKRVITDQKTDASYVSQTTRHFQDSEFSPTKALQSLER
ncbi:hypothetical protein N9X87_00415 [bacterium]|nr:hypothetical protein [bacterium]